MCCVNNTVGYKIDWMDWDDDESPIDSEIIVWRD